MKFTIVVTVYKREELFLHVLYSILQQWHVDWELIVLADGPHPEIDRAIALVKQDKYQAFWDRPDLEDRIQYFEYPKAPEGTVGNPLRRRGLEIASGDYICFVGHDCVLDKDYLIEHKKNIEKVGETCVSVVSVLYWTQDPGLIRYVKGKNVASSNPIPTFIGRIPWSFTGKIDIDKARSGELDLTCFCFPTIPAQQVGVFSPDMDFAYDADFQSFSKLRNIMPVQFSPKTVAGHF